MAMITWWTECQGEDGCGHVSYTKTRLDKCEKCGSLDVVSIRECDEPELDYCSKRGVDCNLGYEE